MKAKISKYFWGLNEKALKETVRVIKNPAHPKFLERMVTLLSRCDQPKELFSLIQKKKFVETWPKTRVYWQKIEKDSDFRDWWQTIYEQLLREYNLQEKGNKGGPSALFLRVGKMLKAARIQKGFSQNELARMIGMRQPDISKIEEGKKNITLKTLEGLCKVLDIKRIILKE